MEGKIDRLRQLLDEARYAVALTGAGVSTESGIPDFRSPDSGLWRMVDPMKVASIEGFRNDPRAFYEFWRWRFAKLDEAQPNVTHRLLAALERRGKLKAVVTQNIDNLHRKAGSRRVLEVHGSYTRGVCLGCARVVPIEDLFEQVEAGRVPQCACGGLLKPDVVLFGELLPPCFEEAEQEVARCDLLLVLGTSLEVYPVAGLVAQADARGAKIAIVARDPTPYDGRADVVIHGQLGAVMGRLRELLGLEPLS